MEVMAIGASRGTIVEDRGAFPLSEAAATRTVKGEHPFGTGVLSDPDRDPDVLAIEREALDPDIGLKGPVGVAVDRDLVEKSIGRPDAILVEIGKLTHNRSGHLGYIFYFCCYLDPNTPSQNTGAPDRDRVPRVKARGPGFHDHVCDLHNETPYSEARDVAVRSVFSIIFMGVAFSGVAPAQDLEPVCAPALIERECKDPGPLEMSCALTSAAQAANPPPDLGRRLIDHSLRARGSLATNIDLIETRLIACGLAEVSETVTARSLLDDEITDLHADFARYWQGADLLPALADLIVAQYDLGFRDDAMRSLTLFDQLAGGAEPLGQVVLAQLALGGHMARLGEMEIADRYFSSVERLWPLLPDHQLAADARVQVDALLMIAESQIGAGARALGAATLDRAERALAEASVPDDIRSLLAQTIQALRGRLAK